jgi:hypothetical protein
LTLSAWFRASKPAVVALAAAIACNATAASLDPPLAPAAAGQLQCYAPDLARKTCRSLATYAIGANGEIRNRAEVLISDEHPITMTTTTVVTIRNGTVCGVIAAADIAAATFNIGDAPADDAQAAQLRSTINSAFQKLFGRQVCTAYVQNGATLIAEATIDGVRDPTLDQTVVWVAPSDGFRVAP